MKIFTGSMIALMSNLSWATDLPEMSLNLGILNKHGVVIERASIPVTLHKSGPTVERVIDSKTGDSIKVTMKARSTGVIVTYNRSWSGHSSDYMDLPSCRSSSFLMWDEIHKGTELTNIRRTNCSHKISFSTEQT